MFISCFFYYLYTIYSRNFIYEPYKYTLLYYAISLLTTTLSLSLSILNCRYFLPCIFFFPPLLNISILYIYILQTHMRTHNLYIDIYIYINIYIEYCVYFSDLGNTSTKDLACYPATSRHRRRRLWQRRRQRLQRCRWRQQQQQQWRLWWWRCHWGWQCSSDRRH